MKQVWKKFGAVLLAITLLLSLTPVTAKASSSKEYISFGSYPQTEIEATGSIVNAQYDANGDTTVNGIRYHRIAVINEASEEILSPYRYFAYEPIVWEKIGNNTYLAQNIVDCQCYDDVASNYTPWGSGHIEWTNASSWEQCTLHYWLEGEFSDIAFSASERAALSEIGLLSYEAAKHLDSAVLRKRPTDYAAACGVKQYEETASQGSGRWFLKDISPVINNAACYISESGSPMSGTLGRVNLDYFGVVPSITVSSAAQLDPAQTTEDALVRLYASWGESIYVKESVAGHYLQNGWYESADAASVYKYEQMNSAFKRAPRFSEYARYVTQYASASGDLSLNYDKMNATGEEILSFVYPLYASLLTGSQRDNVSVYTTFSYDRSCGAKTYEDFEDGYGQEIIDFLRTLHSGDLSGMSFEILRSGDQYQIRVGVYVNSTGRDLYHDYYTKLYELASAAFEYSDRKLGQLEYVREYLTQNMVYDASVMTSSPIMLMLYQKGVCETYAYWMQDVCLFLGIPCLVIETETGNTGAVPGHMWNRIYMEDAWYDLDFTGIRDSDYEVNGVLHRFDPSGFYEGARADNVNFLWTAGIPDPHYTASIYYKYLSDKQKDYLNRAQKILEKVELPSLYHSGAEPEFADVIRGQYYCIPVLWAVNKKIASGTTGATFSPDETCNRAQILTFLWRANGEPEPTITNPFSDIGSSDYYYKAALWAYENAIVSDPSFKADTPCTRAMAVTYLWKLAGSPAAGTSNFTDVIATADYAQAVAWAVSKDITSGTGTRTFSPDSTCTRGQIVTFLYRAYAE